MQDPLVRPDLPGGGLLAGRGGDGGDGVAHRLGQPHAHLTEAPDADHADPLTSLVGPVVDEGSEHRDPGTEHRPCSLQGITLRDLHDKPERGK